ncbi:hypothetical protein B0H13DRAFT_2307306 [Mycena leptocephala]|nr:hypothetical protein B0H13DRAFT_2307306 [Mycena leptocephala]
MSGSQQINVFAVGLQTVLVADGSRAVATVTDPSIQHLVRFSARYCVNLPTTRLDDTMNNEFTMPDPGIFEIQSGNQRSQLLYVQALKTHNKAHTIKETLSGLQAQLGDA